MLATIELAEETIGGCHQVRIVGQVVGRHGHTTHEFYLEFGPAKLVSVLDSRRIQITGLQGISGGGWQINFNFQGSPLPSFQLLKGDSVAGPWVQDSAATIQAIAPGSTYRAVTTSTTPSRYYRIGGN